MIEYTQTSRYYKIVEVDNVLQTDLTVLNVSYTETTVRRGEENNPEILSQRIYNNPNYWWVICQYNGIIDPKNDLPLGKKIRFPNITKSPREEI